MIYIFITICCIENVCACVYCVMCCWKRQSVIFPISVLLNITLLSSYPLFNEYHLILLMSFNYLTPSSYYEDVFCWCLQFCIYIY